MPLRAIVTDPGVENFTYIWVGKIAGSSAVIQSGTASTFTVNRSLYVGTIQVDLVVNDDDQGSGEYKSTLVFGDNGPNIINVTDGSFIPGVNNLTIVSFGDSDIIDATAVTVGRNVVLDGGAGVDYLFGGSGNDTLVLRDGDDNANVLPPSAGTITINDGGDDTYLLFPNSTLTVRDTTGRNTLDFSRANVTTASAPNLGITFDLSALRADQFVIQDVAPTLNLANPHQIRAQGLFSGLVGSGYNDTLTGRSDSTINGGQGADRLVAKDNVVGAKFIGGADADTFEIAANSILSAVDFSGDSGADQFVIGASSSLINIDFNGGADADVFTISNSTLTTIDFFGGADADVFELSGNISLTGVDFHGDSGADIFTIAGSVVGVLSFDGGADADVFNLVANAQIGSIDFSGDSGADVFTIRGNVVSTIDFEGGADADVFTIEVGSRVWFDRLRW